jgi:hypothetical protein
VVPDAGAGRGQRGRVAVVGWAEIRHNGNENMQVTFFCE